MGQTHETGFVNQWVMPGQVPRWFNHWEAYNRLRFAYAHQYQYCVTVTTFSGDVVYLMAVLPNGRRFQFTLPMASMRMCEVPCAPPNVSYMDNTE